MHQLNACLVFIYFSQLFICSFIYIEYPCVIYMIRLTSSVSTKLFLVLVYKKVTNKLDNVRCNSGPQVQHKGKKIKRHYGVFSL